MASRISFNQISARILDRLFTNYNKLEDIQEQLATGKKLNTASKFQVKTSQGIAGIRGTNFTVYSDGSTTVFDGIVVIIFVINGVSSEPITVRAGETVTPPTTPGGIPTKIPTPANVDPGVSVVATVNDGAATTTATVTLPQPSARVGAEFEPTTEQYTPPVQNVNDL